MNKVKDKKMKTVEIGDVFITNLPDGRHGTIKVIDHIEKSYLILTSTYIGEEIPTLENEQVNSILYQNRFSYNNIPDVMWYEGKIPDELKHIGNLNVTEKEQKLSRNSYGGKWSVNCGNGVFLEWRWKYDRENFEREINEQREASRILFEKPQKPKKMMCDELFWEIISTLNWNYEGDDDKVLESAVKKLMKMYVKDIKEFEEALAYKLFLLDTKEHANNVADCDLQGNDDFVSADSFLYARCAVVANGSEFYKLVLDEPKNMPKDIEFEPLLYLASTAYELKTKKDFNYTTGCSYESFSNRDGWKISV